MGEKDRMIDPVVKATLTLVLSKAFKETVQDRLLVVEHSYGDGYFCHDASWKPLSLNLVKRVEYAMRQWLSGPETVVLERKPRQEVIDLFTRIGSESKLGILKQWQVPEIPIVRIGKGYWDYQLEPVEIQRDKLCEFCLEIFNDGFIIRFIENPRRNITPLNNHSKLFNIIMENEQWASILGVSTIHQTNELIQSGEMKEVLWVAEGLHEKKISSIADNIGKEFPRKRIITIAGPSSSGKTSFSKRLAIQLRVNGFRTIPISMDDYFVDRDQLQPGPDGMVDFESVDCMDINLLQARIHKLLASESIPRRVFDFKSGVGCDSDETLTLGEWDFIVLEGIHGLNPRITRAFGIDHVQRIYVSALTQLNIDANHHIATSDNRLFRRMVRDYRYRGYSVEDTLLRWPSVRAGEEANIFPFQEEADYLFNSALIYELPVLAKFARPLLHTVPGDSPVKTEAERLELLLSFFVDMDENLVPGISILREFIGDSDFHY